MHLYVCVYMKHGLGLERSFLPAWCCMLGVVFEPLGGIRSTPFFLINIVLIVGSICFCAWPLLSTLPLLHTKYYSRSNQKVLHHRETCIHRETK